MNKPLSSRAKSRDLVFSNWMTTPQANGGTKLLESALMKRHLIFPALLLATITLLAQTAEVAITAEPHHHLLLENQQVRVWLAEVAPHDSTLMHRHDHDYAFVSIGE